MRNYFLLEFFEEYHWKSRGLLHEPSVSVVVGRRYVVGLAGRLVNFMFV